MRILLIDYSSAFNTVVASKYITKIRSLTLHTSLCNSVFLIGHPQVVTVGNNTSATLTLNTRARQECLLSPLLYSFFMHDCVAAHDSSTIIEFSDDTTVVGLITDDNEAA